MTRLSATMVSATMVSVTTGCALALLGCDDRRVVEDGSVPGVDGGVADLDAARPDGSAPGDAGRDDASSPGVDGGGGADAGSTSAVASCRLGCATVADCDTSAAFDADNYRCEGGLCVYTGCNDDAECRATFASDRYVCRDAGTGVRTCAIGCAAVSDCATGTAAFDADNYRCTGGVCVYEGCNDDAECVSTFGAGYGCRDVTYPETPLIPVAERNCVRLCATVSDCATDSGAFGADNYACESGACSYTGCNDDAECRTSLSNSAYVCR